MAELVVVLVLVAVVCAVLGLAGVGRINWAALAALLLALSLLVPAMAGLAHT